MVKEGSSSARRIRSQLLAVALWGVAFAFVEAAVVVYLRRLFHPKGFAFPIEPRPYDAILAVEVAREAATIVMIGAVAWLTDRRGWVRFGCFMVIFGVWDIFYYVWLWVVLGWPPSLFTLDVLFLIPAVWIGPVWAPCLVSICLIGWGGAVAMRIGAGGRFALGPLGWSLSSLGAVLIVVSFLWTGPGAMRGEMPGPYPWPLFFLGVILGQVAFVRAWREGAPGGSG